MIKKDTIPVAPWKGLFLDGVNVPGGCSKAENVIFLQDGTAERRLYERTLAESPACLASKGLKNLYELGKNSGTRYLFADVDNTDTAIASFGSEIMTGANAISAWSDPADWAYGSSKWTHTPGGATDLVANIACSAATQYRIVTDITCTPPSSSGTYWAYTSTDSTYKWTNFGGGQNIIWSNKWTHSNGAATALTAISEFTPVAGQSYRISVYVTHTSGTGVEVILGGKSAGTIASTGSHELVVTFVTDATGLRFVPSSNWVGVIEATLPIGAIAYSRALSVKKFIDPAGANTAINLGDELLNLNQPMVAWYPEAAASIGDQSVKVYIGGVLGGTITESGTYTYDVTTLVATTALTFTPTANWDGSVNSASVRAITYGASGTKTKVIGGTVTGTTDYEVSWANILTDLTAGDTIQSSWATLQDRAYRVDGVNQNYWFDDASGYHTLGVPAPTDAPVTASTTGGELTAGAYNVYYTYVKKDGDYVVEGNPSPSSNITITGTAITVAVIALTDPDVTHIRIYRTLYNEPGADAYRALEVANATATHTLVLTDDIIGDGDVLEYTHDRPVTGKYVLGAGSRLWLIDTNGFLHWSVLDYPEYMPGVNVQSFDPKDGDRVMGMCALRSNILVFKRRRTWMVEMFSQTTDSDGNAALAKNIVSSTLGCIATGSIQSAGQESAIWLSAAGFILYDGGTFRNISGGDIQTGTPSRIQSVVTDFMKNGAEYNITSTFHSVKQLYHVNFLYRNDEGTEITSQRHFVYNIITDTWTEYVYRVNETQARLYVTNIALGHDSLGNEIVLVPYLVGPATTGVFIFQSDYDPTYVPSETAILLDTSDIGNNSACGLYTMTDSSDNMYCVDGHGRFHKVTSAGTKSVLVSLANIAARAWPATVDNNAGTNGPDDVRPMNFLDDRTNARMFYQLRVSWGYNLLDIGTAYTPSPSTVIADGIFKVTTAGVMTTLSIDTISGSYVHTKLVGIAADSSVLYVLTWDNFKQTAAPTYFRLSSMDITTGALTTLYSFTGITQAIATALDKTPFAMYEDDLYFYRAGNLYVVEAMTSLNTYSTGLTSTNIADIYVESGAKLFLITADDDLYSRFYTGTPSSDTAWSFYESLQSEATVASGYNNGLGLTTYYWSSGSGNVSRNHMIFRNTSGNYLLCGVADYDGFTLFDNDWTLIGRFMAAVSVWPYDSHYDQRGLSWRSTNEKIFYCVGDGVEQTHRVYKVIPNWDDMFDASMTPVGTVAHIVSNYIDLGIAEDKRACGMYVDTMSKYSTIGRMTLESNYNINDTIHVDDETSEPDGSVSRLTFGHPGQKTWNTTGDFDSTVEPWRTHQIGVGLSGQAFRYSLKVGDVVGGGHGLARIRPPRITVQVKGKPSDKKGGR